MENKINNALRQAAVNRLSSPGHRIPEDQGHNIEKNRKFSNSIRTKWTHYIRKLNMNTLFKLGKVKQLTNTQAKFNIKRLAIQGTI